MAEQHTEKRKLSGEVIVALLTILALVLLLAGPYLEDGILHLLKKTPASPMSTTLQATITLSPRQITIVNQDDFPWTDVKVQLQVNAAGAITPYCKLHHLAAHESITLDLVDFMLSPTQRFNAEDIRVMSADLVAKTPHGLFTFP